MQGLVVLQTFTDISEELAASFFRIGVTTQMSVTLMFTAVRMSNLTISRRL
jgi:hypothetical protein